VEVKTSFV